MPDIAERIVDSAMSRLPGAIEGNIHFVMEDVLKEFFKVSTIWRERIRVNVLADRTDYELESVEYPARIISLLWLENADAITFRASLITPNILRLARALEPDYYYAWVVLTTTTKPSNLDYPVFPDWVADLYGDVIADGIVGRMMGQPNKPYTNNQHAIMFSRLFRKGSQEARIHADRQNIQGGQRWRFPRFAAQR